MNFGLGARLNNPAFSLQVRCIPNQLMIQVFPASCLDQPFHERKGPGNLGHSCQTVCPAEPPTQEGADQVLRAPELRIRPEHSILPG
jgi:hypothetical protein